MQFKRKMFPLYFSSAAPRIIALQDLHLGMKSGLQWVDGHWKFNPATLSRALLSHRRATSFYLLPGWLWGFEHMKPICTNRPSDQILPPDWGMAQVQLSLHWWVGPKEMHSQHGIRWLVWGDTSMSSQRSQRTCCGVGISCSEWELLDCSWAGTGRVDKKHIQVRLGKMHNELHKCCILQKRKI